MAGNVKLLDGILGGFISFMVEFIFNAFINSNFVHNTKVIQKKINYRITSLS